MKVDWDSFSDTQKEKFTELFLDTIKNPPKSSHSQMLHRWKKFLKIFVKTFPYSLFIFLWYWDTNPFSENTIKTFEKLMDEHKKIASKSKDDNERKGFELVIEMDRLTIEATPYFVKSGKIKKEVSVIRKNFLLAPNYEQAKQLFLMQLELLQLMELGFGKYVEKAKVQRELEKLYQEKWEKKKDFKLALKIAYIAAMKAIANQDSTISTIIFEIMYLFFNRIAVPPLLTEELADTKDMEENKKMIMSRLEFIIAETMRIEN